MARIRTIKPEFPQSESMGNVSRDARLLFIELWTIADDSGRLRGASRMLASLLFPYDEDAAGLIDGWLDELDREGCILRYKHETGTYIQICNWLSHQKIDRPSPSKIPEYTESSRILANPRESSSLDQGSRIKEGKGSRNGSDHATARAVATIDPLYKPIWDSFLSVTVTFSDYKAEGATCKTICNRIRSLSPDNPEKAAEAILRKYRELVSGADRFWQGQPFTPRGLSPLIDRVWSLVLKSQDSSNGADLEAFMEGIPL